MPLVRHWFSSLPIAIWVFLLSLPVFAQEKTPDLLQIVRSYADTTIERGRDRYGALPSPLFASTLDRKTTSLFQGEGLNRVVDIRREDWGIRPHDRMVTGANPMHDQNLYQALYALTEVTGDRRYALEADRTLKWFFENCQSPVTGLMAWGEHIGWDFNTERLIEKDAGTTHEFFRPWVLWDRSFELAPEACTRFARGLWEHQIDDHKTGNFSRHARYDQHGPGKDSEYPRHGGFYIATWAHAYNKTRGPVCLQAIQTLTTYFESRRNPVSGVIPAESNERSKGTTAWPPSNLSLAIDLWSAAERVPDDLADFLRAAATRTDDVFLKMDHDLSAQGNGFLTRVDSETLAPQDVAGHDARTQLWATGYGEYTDANLALHCLARYGQRQLEGYRRLILDAADRYLTSEPDIEFPVYPGTLGDVISLLLGAHEISGEQRYLDRAGHFADKAISLFIADGSPLPKASSKHDHYEAITRGDTLMMALLNLWIVERRPEIKPAFVFCDR